MTGTEPPSALTTRCPDCGQDTLHSVLNGRAAARGGGLSIDATVQCTECDRVHHAIVKEPAPIEVPVVVSKGSQSRRTRVTLGPEDELEMGDPVFIDGLNCKVMGIESKDGRRVEAGVVKEILTIWAVEFEELVVGFAINLGHKTITKAIPAKPEDEFTIGEERLFGRLRVTVHAIKTKERMLKRGTAEAQEIVRVFAKPTALGGEKHRPDKRSREQMRAREQDRG